MEVMGDSSPFGSSHSLDSKASGQGYRSGAPDIPQSGLHHPDFWVVLSGKT